MIKSKSLLYICLLLFCVSWGKNKKNPTALTSLNQKIYVGGIDQSQSDVLPVPYKQLEEELYASFEKDTEFSMVTYAAVQTFKQKFVVTGKNTNIAKEDLSRAQKLLKGGKLMYHQLQFAKAQSSLQLSKKLLIQNLQHLRNNQSLLQAHLYLGMTLIAQEKKQAAYAEFKKVVYLDLNFSLDPREYSPKVTAIFDQAKAEVIAKPLSVVHIDSIPGANVYINGKKLGPAPQKVSLHQGSYFILAEKRGFDSWYKLQAVSKRVVNVNASLKAQIDFKRWGKNFAIKEGIQQRSFEQNPAVQEARRQGATQLLLVSLQKNINFRLLAQLYDLNKKSFSQVFFFPVEKNLDDYPGAVDDVVSRSKEMLFGPNEPQVNNLNVAAKDPRLQQKAQKDFNKKRFKKPWYKRWWVYPLIAGVAAGGYFASQELTQNGVGDIVVTVGQ